MTNLTDEQIFNDLDSIAKHKDNNERLAWQRKKKKLEGLVEQLEPIEIKILELIASKQPIFDEIQELRQLMVNECVHPIEFLVHLKTHVLCKFCNGSLGLNRKISLLNNE